MLVMERREGKVKKKNAADLLLQFMCPGMGGHTSPKQRGIHTDFLDLCITRPRKRRQCLLVKYDNMIC